MRTYKVVISSKETENPNGVIQYSEYKKEITEETYNKIYKLIV